MTAMQAMEKPRPDQSTGGFRAPGTRLFGGVAGQYRALKRRLADIIASGVILRLVKTRGAAAAHEAS